MHETKGGRYTQQYKRDGPSTQIVRFHYQKLRALDARVGGVCVLRVARDGGEAAELAKKTRDCQRTDGPASRTS